jgi:hypothetical protein
MPKINSHLLQSERRVFVMRESESDRRYGREWCVARIADGQMEERPSKCRQQQQFDSGLSVSNVHAPVSFETYIGQSSFFLSVFSESS